MAARHCAGSSKVRPGLGIPRVDVHPPRSGPHHLSRSNLRHPRVRQPRCRRHHPNISSLGLLISRSIAAAPVHLRPRDRPSTRQQRTCSHGSSGAVCRAGLHAPNQPHPGISLGPHHSSSDVAARRGAGHGCHPPNPLPLPPLPRLHPATMDQSKSEHLHCLTHLRASFPRSGFVRSAESRPAATTSLTWFMPPFLRCMRACMPTRCTHTNAPPHQLLPGEAGAPGCGARSSALLQPCHNVPYATHSRPFPAGSSRRVLVTPCLALASTVPQHIPALSLLRCCSARSSQVKPVPSLLRLCTSSSSSAAAAAMPAPGSGTV